MALVFLTEASSGAPRLSGTNGDLSLVLDWAVVQNGWAIEYSSGFARVYRPGTGNRFRLAVNHDSAASGNAGLAVVRGCENASAANTLVDPFPTPTQVSDAGSNWVVSVAASTTARAFNIILGPTFIIMSINFNGTNVWEMHWFGDFVPTLSGDSYNTVCAIRNSASVTTATMTSSANATYSTSQSHLFFCRNYAGTVKSTFAGLCYPSSIIGNAATANPGAGASGGLDTTKCGMFDIGSNTVTSNAATTQPIRGYFPNLLLPLALGKNTYNARDTYTNTAYNAAFVGVIMPINNNANSAFFVLENSDTWSPPLG